MNPKVIKAQLAAVTQRAKRADGNITWSEADGLWLLAQLRKALTELEGA